MAISRGSGTEIIRSAWFEDVDATDTVLLYGEKHHIYTVLSIIVYAQAIQATGNIFEMSLTGYDSKGGTTAQSIVIFQQVIALNETFVFNDSFSFNGHEPTNFTGPMDDATKQNAIADQGSSVAQKLQVATSNAADSFDVGITFIDRNNV